MGILSSVSAWVSEHSASLIIVLGAVSIVAFILAVFSTVAFRGLSRPFSKISKDSGNKKGILASLIKRIEENRESVEKISGDIKTIVEEGEHHLKHVGLVRFDAFDDIAGKQSYSLCLLDGSNNGFLITYLTGKNFTRSYAVEVKGGKFSRQLGEEEMQAYEQALSGTK